MLWLGAGTLRCQAIACSSCLTEGGLTCSHCQHLLQVSYVLPVRAAHELQSDLELLVFA